MPERQRTVNVNLPLDNYLAARSHAGAVGLSLRAWARQALIETIKTTTNADIRERRTRRKVEVMEHWPKLAELVASDPEWRAVVHRYVDISAAMLDSSGAWPSKDEAAWAIGVEGLFNRKAAS